MNAWLIFSIVSELASRGWIARLPIGIHWIVAHLFIFDQHPEDIDAETIDATLQPEAQDIVHGLTHVGIAPVQIGLLHIKHVQVVLPCLLIELPGRPAKETGPVIRW